MSHIDFDIITIGCVNIDGSKEYLRLAVKGDCEIIKDKRYGEDADGARGVFMRFVSGLKISSIYSLDDEIEVDFGLMTYPHLFSVAVCREILNNYN
jgi:hypothetical protein